MISEDDGSQGRDSEMILFLNYQMSMPKIIRIGDCLLLKKANLIRADLNRVRSVAQSHAYGTIHAEIHTVTP